MIAASRQSQESKAKLSYAPPSVRNRQHARLLANASRNACSLPIGAISELTRQARPLGPPTSSSSAICHFFNRSQTIGNNTQQPNYDTTTHNLSMTTITSQPDSAIDATPTPSELYLPPGSGFKSFLSPPSPGKHKTPTSTNPSVPAILSYFSWVALVHRAVTYPSACKSTIFRDKQLSNRSAGLRF